MNSANVGTLYHVNSANVGTLFLQAKNCVGGSPDEILEMQRNAAFAVGALAMVRVGGSYSDEREGRR